MGLPERRSSQEPSGRPPTHAWHAQAPQREFGVATTVATWTPKQSIQIVMPSTFFSQLGQKFMLAFIISCTAQGNVKRDTSFIGKASSKNTNYSLRPNLLVVFSFSSFITFAMYLYLFIMPRCIMKFLNIKKIKMTNNLGCTARSSR